MGNDFKSGGMYSYEDPEIDSILQKAVADIQNYLKLNGRIKIKCEVPGCDRATNIANPIFDVSCSNKRKFDIFLDHKKTVLPKGWTYAHNWDLNRLFFFCSRHTEDKEVAQRKIESDIAFSL